MYGKGLDITLNNLDKIIDKIMNEAKAEAEAIITEATTYAEGVTAESADTTSDILKLAEKNAERESFATVERAYSTADMKRREIMLATKVGLISKAFADAEQKLVSLSDEDYCIFTGHLLADALADRVETVEKLRLEYGDEEEYSLEFEVVFNKKDKEERAADILKKAKAFLKKKSAALAKTVINVSEETADITGGLILKYGDTETNCSVASVIADERENAEGRVCEILFAPVNGVEDDE